jgi:hypothetical protein
LLFYNGNNTGGATSTGGLSMNWESIVPRRYRRTAPFYANALPVEADFRFPGNIFYKVLNEIYKPYLDRDGAFFIKKMQVTANNSEYVNATITVFKNEDNVFEATMETVEGMGSHVGNALFTPRFVGLDETGKPYLIDALGKSHPTIDVFGQLSSADYSKWTCSDYDAENKLLFVGGNSGMLHVCDLSDMDNIRYKTIAVFPVMNVTGVSLVDNGSLKVILIGYGNGSAAWAQPYHANWADYASNEAVQTASFDHGTGHLRSFIFSGGYYHAITRDGEVFRTADLATMWNQVADIDAEFIAIAPSANRLWVAEVNDDSLLCYDSNTSQYYRWGGLRGTKKQKQRALLPLLEDHILVITDDANECIWDVDPVGDINQNITPSGIVSAGGSCFDGEKFGYVAVVDAGGYPKIATYNADVVLPEAMWSYMGVEVFLRKLWEW